MDLMVDWRPLLDSIRVPWRDRGSNTRSGNVNVCCPFCKDDQGFHLALSENTEAYYCYRRPMDHLGRNVIKVLVALGQDRPDAIRLLNQFRSNAPVQSAAPAREADDFGAERQWQQFDLAHGPYLDYLEDRGFPDAEHVAMRYDLRCARQGTWAARLLMPVVRQNRVWSWHGRSITPWIEPKYLAEAKDAGKGLLYVPSTIQQDNPRSVGIVLEGQMDALKAAASGYPDVFPVAVAGKSLTPAKLLQLRELFRACRKVVLALDADTTVAEASRSIAELHHAHFRCPVGRVRLPPGVKDVGEMTYQDVGAWLVRQEQMGAM